MPFSWINRSKRPLTLDDLVGAGEYAKAIDFMRKKFSQRHPSTSERQQYAEVLVGAGRGAEAVPVLLGVADEQELYGFPDKALEALRCAAVIAPGHPEVKKRLESIGDGPRSAPPVEEPRARACEPHATPQEPGSVAEERPGEGPAESLAAAVGVEGEPEPAPPYEVLELVEVEGENHELTKPSFVPEPADGDAAPLETIAASSEDHELTKPSFVPGPADGDAEAAETVAASSEDHELTKPSFVPEPADGDAVALESSAEDVGDGETTPTSIRVEVGVVSARQPEPEPNLILPEEELELVCLDEHLEAGLTTDAQALLSTGPKKDDPGSPEDDGHLFLSEDDLFADMLSLLAEAPETLSGENESEGDLEGLVRALAEIRASDGPTLGSVLFADLPREELHRMAEGLHRRRVGPDDIVIREGEPGHSLFLIASGSVRIFVTGRHGHRFEIRKIEAGDFFGEVAALSDKPRTATAVAASPCEMLEIERAPLDALLARRPAGRPLLDAAWARRALSPEETAVRSLPPEAGDPRRAAEALRAEFAGSDWSPRVRLQLSRMMLDAGRADDALATLAGVAEDLAQRGHAKDAIAILKKAGRARRRGSDGSAEDTAFRERVESLLPEATELAARAAPSV